MCWMTAGASNASGDLEIANSARASRRGDAPALNSQDCVTKAGSDVEGYSSGTWVCYLRLAAQQSTPVEVE